MNPDNEISQKTVATTKVFRQGGSLRVTIPQTVANNAKIRDGETVVWVSDGKRILLTPTRESGSLMNWKIVTQ